MSEEMLAAQQRVMEEPGDVLRVVFEVSYRRLVVQLYGVTGDLAEAEDVVQEAFVRAAATRSRFRAVDNHEAWLRTTAIHLHRNRFRKMRNFSRIRHRLEHPTDPAGLEQHIWVIDALRALPEHQRQVLALHYLADLPVTEIAAALGCATGTVKSRLKRGREALAATLARGRGAPMSERMLKDFAERAETRVLLPDFEQIQSRGRDLRRTRLALAGALAVFLLVAGGVVATVATGQKAAPPAEDPKPTEVHELDSRPFDYRKELMDGVDYTFRPWSLDQSTVEARLTVPGRGWIWWGDGLTRPDRDGVSLFPIPRERYATVGVMLADRVATTQCRSFHMEKKPEWDAISRAPLAAVRQIAAVPGVTVLDRPRADTRFGYRGAHVRLSVPKLCADTQAAVLWSVSPGEYDGNAGVATVRYAGQVMDVWVVDVGGTPVVVYAELSPGLPESYAEELRAVVDSIKLKP